MPDPNSGTGGAGAILDFIRSQVSDKDSELLDCLQDACNPEKLDYSFYCKALSCNNSFLREYLRFDLLLRDTKTEYLNKIIGRPEGQDIIPLPGTADEYEAPSCPEFDEKPAVLAVLEQDDIMARERGLDRLLWDKAEELVRMHIFDLDVILSVVARLLITDRWDKLDPATGREMFRSLVQEIRNTR